MVKRILANKLARFLIIGGVLATVVILRIIFAGEAGDDGLAAVEAGQSKSQTIGDALVVSEDPGLKAREERASKVTAYMPERRKSSVTQRETGSLEYMARLVDPIDPVRGTDPALAAEEASEKPMRVNPSLFIEFAPEDSAARPGREEESDLRKLVSEGRKAVGGSVSEFVPQEVANALQNGVAGSNEAARPVREIFAPAGEVIEAELLYTLESSNDGTPIVGIVTQSLYWNGHEVVPAGSKIVGKSTADYVRDRINGGNTWTIVLPQQGNLIDGRELIVTGSALDREEYVSGVSWGIGDGAFGLRGYVLRSASFEDAMLYLSTFLGAGAQAFQERESDPYGNQRVANTAKNAALEGMSAVMAKKADMLIAEIERNGAYIQVPAGKQFYLFLERAIILSDARVAATRGVN